jgi:ankyrin repeat protein
VIVPFEYSKGNMEQPKVDSDIHMLGCFGDRDGLAKCADGGTDMTATDMYGRSSLHWAARAGHDECCTYLMGIDLDKNAADAAGMTPLLHAAQNGMEITVKILCDNGCDANIVDNNGNSAMHYACQKGILGMVQCLNEKGASLLTLENKCGFTPAHVSSQNGHLVITRYLVKMLEAKELDSGNKAGNTPLHIASACGFKNICKTLMDAGCDANKTNGSGKQPVDMAITNATVQAFE